MTPIAPRRRPRPTPRVQTVLPAIAILALLTSCTTATTAAAPADNRVDEAWDVGAQSPHFTYTVDGVQHDVWYENGRSAAAKFSLARQYGLGGVELWRLGGEDPAVWAPGP